MIDHALKRYRRQRSLLTLRLKRFRSFARLGRRHRLITSWRARRRRGITCRATLQLLLLARLSDAFPLLPRMMVVLLRHGHPPFRSTLLDRASSNRARRARCGTIAFGGRRVLSEVHFTVLAGNAGADRDDGTRQVERAYRHRITSRSAELDRESADGPCKQRMRLSDKE